MAVKFLGIDVITEMIEAGVVCAVRAEVFIDIGVPEVI